MQKTVNLNNVASATVYGNDQRIHFWYMKKNEAINIMDNFELREASESLFLSIY